MRIPGLNSIGLGSTVTVLAGCIFSNLNVAALILDQNEQDNLMGWASCHSQLKVSSSIRRARECSSHSYAHTHSASLFDSEADKFLLQSDVYPFGMTGHAQEQDKDKDEIIHVQVETPPPALEMIPLIVSGSSSNRVDLVFFSDGYLPEERQKFIDDALRLAEDVSQNQTFNTVQPLLNFWAGFSPSEESGVGTHGKPKKTPFGLYRDGTELRGVYYAHPEVGKAACDSLGDQCDYPILLGNDPLYGGLGGDFTVITASILNGPLVLRHELGHSILDVGEEYDGGFAYFGRNAAHDIVDFTWKQWLSDPSRTDENGNHRVERSNMAMQAYPWTLLNTTQPWSIRFSSPGTYARHKMQFSLSGVPEKGDLRVTLDDVDLQWEPRSDVGMDRWFYNFYSDVPLGGSDHELKFTLLNAKNEGVAQLCSTEILEYGNEDEFVSKPGFYGLYPTYSDKNETSYRPTNDDCLMRAVATPNFCKACIETLWLKLLRNITFIENIDVANESCGRTPSGQGQNQVELRVVALDLLPLAGLRKTPIAPGESYTIVWKKGSHDGETLGEFTNKTRIEVPAGEYAVEVNFWTEEVRVSSPVLKSEAKFTVESACDVGLNEGMNV